MLNVLTRTCKKERKHPEAVRAHRCSSLLWDCCAEVKEVFGVLAGAFDWNKLGKTTKVPLNPAYEEKGGESRFDYQAEKNAFEMILKAFQKYKSAFGEKQSGGYIPNTGMYQLHAGEAVMTARELRESTTNNYTFSAGAFTVSQGVNAQQLFSEIERMAKLKRGRMMGG